MPPPSVSWVTIPAGDLDPDSPITTELMTALYSNEVFNSEWIGARAAAKINHRHRSLATDGTDNVDYGSLTGAPAIPGPVLAMCTWTGLVIEGGGAQVIFGTASVIGFWPAVLLLNVSVTYVGAGPAGTTQNWSGRCSNFTMAGHYGPATGQWFGGGGVVAIHAASGVPLACLFMGAPGMAATFQWSAPVPALMTRTTEITLTAIGQ